MCNLVIAACFINFKFSIVSSYYYFFIKQNIDNILFYLWRDSDDKYRDFIPIIQKVFYIGQHYSNIEKFKEIKY